MKVYKFLEKIISLATFTQLHMYMIIKSIIVVNKGLCIKKALFFKDFEIADEIINTKYDDPVIYKKLGRKVSNFNEKEWSYVRFDIMVDLIYARCLYNTDYKKLLLSLKILLSLKLLP